MTARRPALLQAGMRICRMGPWEGEALVLLDTCLLEATTHTRRTPGHWGEASGGKALEA